MFFPTLHTSLSSWDVAPGSVISKTSPARTMYHETSQDLMILRGIHVAVEEAFSSITKLEHTFRESGDEETTSPGPELHSINKYVHKLRSHIEGISQMAHNMEEKLAQNIPSSAQFANAATAQATPESSHRDALIFDDHSPSHFSATTSNLPPLVVSAQADAPAMGEDDEDAYYAPPVPITTNDPPPLLPAQDLSAVYEAVIERRLKRKLSQDLQDAEVLVHSPPLKRRKDESRQLIYQRAARLPRRNLPRFAMGLLDPVATIAHFWSPVM